MDLLTQIDVTMKALIGAATLLGVLFGFLKWVRPRMKSAASDTAAVRDAILGREAVKDSITGRELAPALPGIGVRMATIESAVALLADQGGRLDSLEHRVESLEEARVERVVAKVESAQAWRTMEAVANATPPDDTPLPGLGEN